MQPFTFQYSRRGELHRHAHAPGDAVVVDGSNWPLLTAEWPDDDRSPYLQHAVNNNNTEEVAV